VTVATEYTYGDQLLRVADGVLEQFSMAVAGSLRIPMAWLSVETEPRKHDVIRVQIGKASDPAASIYSSIAFTNPAFSFEIPASEEANLRAFLDWAAEDAGRSK
jgi:hypothetical protein